MAFPFGENAAAGSAVGGAGAFPRGQRVLDRLAGDGVGGRAPKPAAS